MAHIRKTIRAAIVDLVKQVPAFENRVHALRAYPLGRDELPGACVYSAQEDSERGALNRSLNRSMEFYVDVYVRDTDSPDDALDDLCEAIEILLDAEPTFAGEAFDCVLTRTTIGIASGGEKPAGLARLTYTVTTRTVRGAPGTTA